MNKKKKKTWPKVCGQPTFTHVFDSDTFRIRLGFERHHVETGSCCHTVRKPVLSKTGHLHLEINETDENLNIISSTQKVIFIFQTVL